MGDDAKIDPKANSVEIPNMEDPVVELQSGLIRGVVEKHEDGFDFYTFKGVPYAEKPIGELRFEDPVPKKKWTGTLDCKNYGSLCMQFNILTNEESINEDCLYLNIFTRSINKPNKNAPVMVWIHGGDFSFGTSSGNFTGPDHLIRKDIVLIFIEYRLGVLGFLNLDDEVAPGNKGLKDQIMALKWVQENVRKFGGDPNNVTIFGMSAGAISAHYLALSPITKGLFHKVIYQGNSLYTEWARCLDPRAMAIKFCSILGQNSVDPKEIVKFLKTVEPRKLLDAQQKLWEDRMVFTPGMDDKSKNPVMPIDPYIAATKGVHLPCLMGCNSMEGLMFFFVGSTLTDYLNKCDKDFMNLLHFGFDRIFERHNLSLEQVRRLYFKKDAITEKNLKALIELKGDIIFVESLHTLARIQAERSSAPTYMYRFNYDSSDSPSKIFLKNAPFSGVCHFDDLPFLFKLGKPTGFQNYKKGTREYKMIEQMTEMWTNFAKHGRPTVGVSDLIPVHWKPLNDGTVLRYMNIDDDLTMQSTLNIDQKYLSARDIQV